mgnify:CR=1 FL=1
MTRRERLEHKIEKRLDWAASRDHKSAAGFERARAIADNIPLGQPILVGHHSEGHARRDQDRIHAGMSAGIESADMAKHHRSAAAGIEPKLETSIFSDDAGAAESCEAKAGELESYCERYKALAADWRKRIKAEPDPAKVLAAMRDDGLLTQDEALKSAHSYAIQPYHGTPWPSYGLTNARANARRYRERAKQIREREKVAEQAAAAPGGVLITKHAEVNWCRVTFAEKPERAIMDALKAAGYGWGSGHWAGHLDRLPAAVAALEVQP